MQPKYALKTFLATAIIVIALPSLATSSLAASHGLDDQHCKHGRGMDASHQTHEGMPPFMQDLNLSSTQKDQITALMAAQKPVMEAQWKQRQQLMKALPSLVNADTLDEKKTSLIAEKMAQLEKEQVMNRAKVGNKMFAILTPEQRKQFIERMQKHLEKMDKAEMAPAGLEHYKQKVMHWIKS